MIYLFDAPSDFKIPISRVRSVMVVYMERKMTRNPMPTAIAIMARNKVVEPGEIIRGHQRHVLFNRQDRVLGQQLVNGLGSVCRCKRDRCT